MKNETDPNTRLSNVIILFQQVCTDEQLDMRQYFPQIIFKYTSYKYTQVTSLQ